MNKIVTSAFSLVLLALFTLPATALPCWDGIKDICVPPPPPPSCKDTQKRCPAIEQMNFGMDANIRVKWDASSEIPAYQPAEYFWNTIVYPKHLNNNTGYLAPFGLPLYGVEHLSIY